MGTLDRTYKFNTLAANDNELTFEPTVDEEFDEGYGPLEAFVSGLMSMEADDLLSGVIYE